MSLNAFTFANVAASQTDSVVITGIPNRNILVLGVATVTGATATTIVFNSKSGGGGGTAITMTFQNAANGGFVLPINDGGWFQTNSGESLTVTTGAGSTTGVQVVYTFILTPGAYA